MMEPMQERLYRLLPSIYRQRDQDQGGILRILMNALEGEFQTLELDMDTLYKNWFIETCDDWVVPYIAQLLGLFDFSEKKNQFFSQRRRVANTISYRRRKGTLAVLEHIAQDVTGWNMRVVEYTHLLAATQHLDHIQADRAAFVDLRQASALAALEGPFDTSAHTIDIRSMQPVSTDMSSDVSGELQGKYQPGCIGLFAWQLQSYQMVNVPAAPISKDRSTGSSLPAGCFTCDPRGHDIQLYNVSQDIPLVTSRAPANAMPGPLSRAAFAADLAAYDELSSEEQAADSLYYGPNSSLYIMLDDRAIPPGAVMSADLSQWQAPVHSDTNSTKRIAIDIEAGRLMLLGTGSSDASKAPNAHVTKTTTVTTTYTYGFSGDYGGGPYIRQLPPTETFIIDVQAGTATDTLQLAMKEWETYCSTVSKPRCTMRILDNRAYTGHDLTINLPANSSLVIEATHSLRPLISPLGNIHIVGQGANASLQLNGLLIQRELSIQGSLKLDIVHCTLMPHGLELHHTRQAGSAADLLQLCIDHSIVGPVRLRHGRGELRIQDSIVDGGDRGLFRSGISQSPDASQLGSPSAEGESVSAIDCVAAKGAPGIKTSLERVTIFGLVYLQEIVVAQEVIFTAPVFVVEQRTGLVSFSYVPNSSQTPHRYRCQPDLSQKLDRDEPGDLVAEGSVPSPLYPLFTSTRYGDAGYAQLSRDCAMQIRRGAADGSEMGAFHDLRSIQRQDNLYHILDEYFPFGLAVNICYVT